QSPLEPKWHTAAAEIPHHGRIRRAQWQDALLFPDGNIRALFRLHRGRQSAKALCAVAGDAALLQVELCPCLGGAGAGREFLSGSTDRDVHAAELFGGRRASYAVGG